MGFRYIICDDAPFIRELIKEQLFKMGGLCIAESDEVAKTVLLCDQLRPDYLILDLVLPNKSGIELFHLITNDLNEMKIIICSSLDRETVLTRSPYLAKYLYLQKPFNSQQLNQIFLSRKKLEVINE